MLLCRHDWKQAFEALSPATLLRSMREAHRCSQSRQGGDEAWLGQGADVGPSKPTRADAREGFDSKEGWGSKSDSMRHLRNRRGDGNMKPDTA